MNIEEKCGENLDRDADGQLVPKSKTFFQIIHLTVQSVQLVCGFYIGQLIFRTSGQGKLGHEAYSSRGCNKIVGQVAFVLLTFGIWTLSGRNLEYQLSKDDLSEWKNYLYINIIPSFLVAFSISYLLPAVSNKVTGYPTTEPDEKDGSKIDDKENQLQGKLSNFAQTTL